MCRPRQPINLNTSIMKLQDYDTTQRYEATVVSSERITPEGHEEEVRNIILDVEAPSFEVSAGQSIGVLAPGQEEMGQEHHFRLYSVADLPEGTPSGHVRLTICVKRCTYIDDYSGERYDGVASNYLCDLQGGDTLTITGPYGLAFPVPDDKEATLVLIGAGTGIAPFRAFLKHLYQSVPDYAGRVILFHGARTGLDLLYRNDERDDFTLYYDKDTFEAVAVLGKRPHWSDDLDWKGALATRGEDIWKMLGDEHTRVYLAGLKEIRDELDAVFAGVAGSAEEWSARKDALAAEGRWTELLY